MVHFRTRKAGGKAEKRIIPVQKSIFLRKTTGKVSREQKYLRKGICRITHRQNRTVDTHMARSSPYNHRKTRQKIRRKPRTSGPEKQSVSRSVHIKTILEHATRFYRKGQTDRCFSGVRRAKLLKRRGIRTGCGNLAVLPVHLLPEHRMAGLYRIFILIR